MSLALSGAVVVRGGRVVLAGVDLSLRAGEVTVVIGPNGAGKSTLIRAMAGLLPLASGEARLGGEALAGMAARARARRIACGLEEPDATFTFTARELVAMGRYPHVGRAFEGAGDRAATEAALARLELGRLAERPYGWLSSGERQRVSLARIVAQEAEVVLLDEPTARLDPYHALRVAGLLRELAGAGRTVLAAEHDLDLAAQMADRMVMLAAGRIVADGAPGEVLTEGRVGEVYGVRARRVDGGRVSLVMESPLQVPATPPKETPKKSPH